MDDKKSGKNNPLTPEDIDLWQKMTKDVRKMPGTNHQTAVKATNKIKPPTKSANKQQKPPALPPKSKPVSPLPGSSELDARTSERFRKGQIPIEATLDLHGMTQAEAYTALLSFLKRAHGKNYRCILIITGKGKENMGVLRQNLPSWLAEHDTVLKTAPARPKDGGSGAFYVYLRRNKTKN